MKKTSISIPFDDDKLRAAQFYAGKKDADIESELGEQLQKLYEKYVPRDTREYIESQPVKATAKSRTAVAKSTAIVSPQPPSTHD